VNLRDASNSGDAARLDLTPLIDVVFQLLIFFVITMTFHANNESLLPVDLAEVASGGEGAREAFMGATITVTAAGAVVMDGRDTLSDAELRARLVEIHAYEPKAQILLRGDERASHGRVLVVLDIVKSVGFATVDMVVTRFEPGGAG
jgi:biopolymer transport protein ExbD